MQASYTEIQIKYCELINLYFMGDFHIGHQNFDEKKLLRDVKTIQEDKNGYVFIMGDNCDNRQPHHKFFDPAQISPKFPMKNFIKNCYRYFEDIVIDLQPRVIGIHDGNHDYSTVKRGGHPYTESICETHNINYLGYRALNCISIRCLNHGSARSIWIFTTHGSGGGRKTGAKVNRIEEEMMSTNADIYVQGHNHGLSVLPGIKHSGFTRNKSVVIQERPMLFINSGSYLKSYQQDNYSYSEKASYRPQPTGYIRVTIDSTRNKITGQVVT